MTQAEMDAINRDTMSKIEQAAHREARKGALRDLLSGQFHGCRLMEQLHTIKEREEWQDEVMQKEPEYAAHS